jgi:hypothetical protein
LTIVVLLILVVVWVAVLAPSLLRRRFERRSGDSIGEFHQHLRVLRRTGPVLVPPAVRLTTAVPEDSAGHRSRHAAVGGRGLILIRPDATVPPPRRVASGTQRPDPYFRPEACKRRRDVLAVMGCVIIGSGVLGAIPVLRPLLGLTAFALVVAALYVVMLVRLGGRASERAAKLRYLPQPVQEDEPTIVIRRAAR